MPVSAGAASGAHGPPYAGDEILDLILRDDGLRARWESAVGGFTVPACVGSFLARLQVAGDRREEPVFADDGLGCGHGVGLVDIGEQTDPQADGFVGHVV
jgi:hypothetical protein